MTMKKYRLNVIETVLRTFVVEAGDEEEAEANYYASAKILEGEHFLADRRIDLIEEITEN